MHASNPNKEHPTATQQKQSADLLLQVPRHTVVGKAGGDDKGGAAAEKDEAGLETDLDAATGDDDHPPGQVGPLVPLLKVERGARRAELGIKVVDLVEAELAPAMASVPSSRLGLPVSLVGGGCG